MERSIRDLTPLHTQEGATQDGSQPRPKSHGEPPKSWELMPIRFQVDSDFYDHPKVIDLSDAAVALWTRAGSYSAGKLTDGFIPDKLMPKLSAVHAVAAAELVKAKLWRRVRGGFQFHQWELRNLTRGRIEHERKHDRERKANRAHNSSSSESPQVKDDTFRPESGGNPAGIPGGSVSVSVSESLSVSSSSYVSSADNFEQPPIQDETKSKPVSVGAARLSRIYCDRIKLSDRGKVSMVCMNALGAGYTDDVIGGALNRLADSGMPVTMDTLRIEIEGKKPSNPYGLTTGTDGVVRAPGGRPIRGKGWEES